MKAINIKRLGQTMLWSLVNEKKKYISNFIGMFIFYLITMTMSFGLLNGYKNGVSDIQVVSAAGLCTAAWIVMGGWFTAELFSNLRKKNGRAQFFLLPATNCEKYCSRLILALGKGLILSTVAFLAADIIQMLISFIFCGDAVSVTKYIVSPYSTAGFDFLSITLLSIDTTAGLALDYIFNATFAIWLVSVYILGGTYLRKIPAILTTMILLLIFVVGSSIVGGIIAAMFSDGTYEVEFLFPPRMILTWTCIILFIGFSVFNIWLSYRKFRRTQII